MHTFLSGSPFLFNIGCIPFLLCSLSFSALDAYLLICTSFSFSALDAYLCIHADFFFLHLMHTYAYVQPFLSLHQMHTCSLFFLCIRCIPLPTCSLFFFASDAYLCNRADCSLHGKDLYLSILSNLSFSDC